MWDFFFFSFPKEILMISLLEVLVDVGNLVYIEFRRINLLQCCKADKRQFLNVLMTILCSEII